jgi:hypothetical protein
MLSHGIIHVSHVAGLLYSFDDVTKAKLVHMAKNKGDLEQEIATLSQPHVFNVQRLFDLEHLAMR